MFDPTSRYASIETATLSLPNGQTVAYKRRRFLPRGDSLRLLAEVTVAEGDRLDLLAARTINDPTQYWRIADANDAMDPTALVDRPGRVLRVSEPRP